MVRKRLKQLVQTYKWFKIARSARLPDFKPLLKPECLIELILQFWIISRSQRVVSTISSPYIMPKRTYERIKKIAIPSL